MAKENRVVVGGVDTATCTEVKHLSTRGRRKCSCELNGVISEIRIRANDVGSSVVRRDSRQQQPLQCRNDDPTIGADLHASEVD